MTNSGNKNLITSGPSLADANIADNYSELKANTNYNEVIIGNGDTTYVSDIEVQAAYTYRDTFKGGDIITILNNFANSLQVKYFADENFSFDTILFWYQKIKFTNKELISLSDPGTIYGNKILPNVTPAVSKNLLTGFLGGLNLQQSFFKIGSFTSLGNLLTQSNNVLGGISNPSDTGIPQQSFLDCVSDSIGLLANSKYIQLDSTLPIFDVSQEYYGVPIPYSTSTESKISNNTRNIAYDLSRSTTALMRRNLLNIAYTNPAYVKNMATDASVAHGQNLINDLPTFVEINSILPALVSAISSRFKLPRVFNFVQYLSNIGNQTAANLRDIFPLEPSDRDFTVITTEERALASKQEAQSIADDAATNAYLAQQGINYATQYSNPLGGSSGAANDPTITPVGDGGRPPSMGDTKSKSAELNKKLDDANVEIKTFVGKNNKEYVDKQSYSEYLDKRLDGSPLIGYVPADGARYGITTGSREEWKNVMMQMAEHESGFEVHNQNLSDPGGSYGINQIGPAQAVAYGGYKATTKNNEGSPSLTPAEASNVRVNANTAVSMMERFVTRDGVIGGGSYGRAGAGRTWAQLTLNKTSAALKKV